VQFLWRIRILEYFFILYKLLVLKRFTLSFALLVDLLICLCCVQLFLSGVSSILTFSWMMHLSLDDAPIPECTSKYTVDQLHCTSNQRDTRQADLQLLYWLPARIRRLSTDFLRTSSVSGGSSLNDFLYTEIPQGVGMS